MDDSKNKHVYSIVLLKEAIIKNPVVTKDHKLFEERLILISISENLLRDKEKFLIFIRNLVQNNEEIYPNEFGEMVIWKLAKIIDVFEISEDIEFSLPFQEVYSRFLEMPANASIDDVVNKFYSDYVWEIDVILKS